MGDQLSPELAFLLRCLFEGRSNSDLGCVLKSRLNSLDWSKVVRGAVRNLVAPSLLDFRLFPDGFDGTSDAVLLKESQLYHRMHTMKIVSCARSIKKEYLDRYGIDHAFVKGPFLSKRIYGNEFARVYRDLDLLVDVSSYQELVSRLVADGYKITNAIWPVRVGADLGVLCRYAPVVELKSPESVSVEIHRSLDSNQCLFNTRELLSRSESIDFGGHRWRVLEFVSDLVYSVFHHARHGWDKLHWCADLLRIEQHVSLRRREFEHCARRAGLLKVTNSALAFADALKRFEDSRFECSILLAWAKRLEISFLDTEDYLRSLSEVVVPLGDPNFKCESETTVRYRMCRSLKRMLPTLSDYEAFRLPLRYHFLYSFVKPFRYLANRGANG